MAARRFWVSRIVTEQQGAEMAELVSQDPRLLRTEQNLRKLQKFRRSRRVFHGNAEDRRHEFWLVRGLFLRIVDAEYPKLILRLRDEVLPLVDRHR